MGCLTVCRWCCCCFIVTYNIIMMIFGIACFAIGCMTVWGYWVMRQAIDANLNSLIESYNKNDAVANMDVESIHKAIETTLASVAVVFLVLGAFIIIFSCIGCCGACFAVPTCLIIYVVIVGLGILTNIIVVIIWFSNKDIFLGCLRSKMEKEVAGYKGASQRDMGTLMVDLVQLTVGCCGVYSGEEFKAMNWNRSYTITEDNGRKHRFNLTYPDSCCMFDFDNQKMKDKFCPYNGTDSKTSNYLDGCYPKIKKMLIETYGFDNMFYSVASDVVFNILLIAGALVIFFFKRQEQDDVPHSGVQYKMQPQMA